MEKLPHIPYDEYRFHGIKEFEDIVITKKCIYYASDFLRMADDNLAEIEEWINRTMEVFTTLQIPVEEHFYLIFRGRPDYIYKDWKLSGLACVYMMMDGDPTDVGNLARQQTTLIDQMLQHIHPTPIHIAYTL